MTFNPYEDHERSLKRIHNAWNSAPWEDERERKSIITFEFDVTTHEKHRVECEVDQQTISSIQVDGLTPEMWERFFENHPEVHSYLDDCEKPRPHDWMITDPQVETQLQVVTITDIED
jgi:hypothetical protein